MKYDLVIFDLDGTILNTLSDLAAACNAALAMNGFPTHSQDKIRTCIGSGVSNLIRLALPENVDSATHTKVLTDFREYYSSHVDVQTAPYPGICEMLRKLKSAGLRIGVNSNKFDAAVQTLCSAHFGDLIDMARGEISGTPKKPDPAGANAIISALGAEKARTLYVGDSGVDVQTALNAGVDGAWVSWGFRSRSELGDIDVPHAFDDAAALTQFILG